jgi:phenylalanyl-tRNA synthetase beta chain
MKIPLSWLREYVDFEWSPKELAHRLTMAGTEVEAIAEIGTQWQRVVVAQIVDLGNHPNADNLLIAKVDRGDGTSTIVTGAPNLSVGLKVPVVMAGGRLPAGEISRRKFRGIESEGMLCAGDELGLSSDHEGIYVLEPEAPLGEDLRRLLGDTVFDLYITPNRPDCMSVIGIAREVQALAGGKMRPLQWTEPRGEPAAADLCSVEVADPDLAPRYSATVIRALKIGPSPAWMQRRLFLSGFRPINNVVDITNYVLLETGQPLHAFDRAKVNGGIVVRRARPGERITTIDGQERTLGPDMLLIADHAGPIGIAGVMGGADSEIGPDTHEVVLESANFDAISLRRTSRHLGLKTEASHRFERGLDPGLTVPSAARATQLMAELAAGRPAGGVIDLYPRPAQPRRLTLSLADVSRLLGKRYESQAVSGILRSLDFGVETDGESLEVTVPSYRRDVERKADLIEEVARIAGYDEIPEALFQGRIPEPKLDRRRIVEERARLALVAAGCQEVITYSLVHPDQVLRLDLNAQWPPAPAHPEPVEGRQPTADSRHDLSRVANPMSVEHSALRQTLLGSLLETVSSNLRYRERVWIFELARVYLPPFDPLPREPLRLGLALAGQRQPQTWSQTGAATDFFDLKGVVEMLLEALRIEPVTYRSAEHETFQPGTIAELIVRGPEGERSLGALGQLHSRVAERFDLEGQPVVLAELDFDALSQLATDSFSTPELPRFPGLQQDLALIVNEATSHELVLRELQEAGGELLAEARLFDVYRGDPIPAGHKSLAYSLTFRAPDRTLTDAEAAEAVGAIELRLAERLGARVRRA